MGHGKRGPNGGVIDIDDPEEVMPPTDSTLRTEVRSALRLTEWAAHERMKGRGRNADLFLDRAAAKLAAAIREAR
jgi:hypothetical protein